MVNSKYLIMGCAVLVGGGVAFLIFWQSEEAKVRKQFDFIAEKIEKTAGESPIIAAAKANQIREAITENLRINAPDYSSVRSIPSDELSTLVLSMRSRYSEISVWFHDIVIEFPEDEVASVNLTAVMDGKLIKGEHVEDLHELKCILEKIEDAYPIDRIGLKIGLLPFLDDYGKILQQYEMDKELEIIFNEKK